MANFVVKQRTAEITQNFCGSLFYDKRPIAFVLVFPLFYEEEYTFSAFRRDILTHIVSATK